MEGGGGLNVGGGWRLSASVRAADRMPPRRLPLPTSSPCRAQGAILTGEAAATKVSNLLKTGKSG